MDVADGPLNHLIKLNADLFATVTPHTASRHMSFVCRVYVSFGGNQKWKPTKTLSQLASVLTGPSPPTFAFDADKRAICPVHAVC